MVSDVGVHDATGDAQRCALWSRRDEDPAGTGPHAPRWLVVEDPAPWGRDALLDGGLPSRLRAHLADQVARHGVRHQAIRRPDRSRNVRRTVIAANLDAGWTARTTAPVEDLLDLDLGVIAADDPPHGWECVVDPVLLVCTHAKRDACCALWGRPAALGLAALAPEATWETSHTAGHRLAASVVVLPHGSVFGRVERLAAFLRDARADRLDLSTYRGSARWTRVGQAAEIALRRHTGHLEVAGIAVLDERWTKGTGLDEGDRARVTLTLHGRRWQVALAVVSLPDRPLSCGTEARPLRPLVATDVRASER